MSSRGPLQRTGSAMSSKQIAYAAVRGRKVKFQWLRGERTHVIDGYIVGADDYHWLVAQPTVVNQVNAEPEGRVHTHLVAKGRAEIISLSPDATLTREPASIKIAIEEMGRGFVTWCNRHYFGDGSAESEEPLS